jgi:phage gpG-like protein
VVRTIEADVLHVQTGRLRRSIHAVAGGTDAAPSAAVGTNVVYAAIHEFGGKTRPHRIEPKEKMALAFMVVGQEVFAKNVNHPRSRMPER